MNNKKSKKQNSPFVLNDVIKRKILEMYKISSTESTEKKNVKKTKKILKHK